MSNGKLSLKDWIGVAGFVIALITMSAGLAVSYFFSRAEGLALAARVDGKAREQDYRDKLQDDFNFRVREDLKELKSEQRATSDNVIKIGERLRVRGLTKNDGE